MLPQLMAVILLLDLSGNNECDANMQCCAGVLRSASFRAIVSCAWLSLNIRASVKYGSFHAPADHHNARRCCSARLVGPFGCGADALAALKR
jgi:hypothetical protein